MEIVSKYPNRKARRKYFKKNHKKMGVSWEEYNQTLPHNIPYRIERK